MPFDHPPSFWQQRLNEAASRRDVVVVARDYVARMSPPEFARLPEPCRPSKIVDADDVTSYALTLVQCSCAGDKLTDQRLQRMAAFFTRASVRLAQLATVTRETTENA